MVKWKLIIIIGLIMFGMVFIIRDSDMEINRLTRGFVLGQELLKGSSASEITSNNGKWNFEKIQEDLNVDVNISAINSSVIEITIFEKPTSTLANSYKFDLVLINLSKSSGLKYQNEDAKGGFDNAFPINVNYDLITNYGVNETWGDKNNDYGYILFSSGSKNQLPKKLRLIVPDDLTDFELYFGKGSVLITASALNTDRIKGEMLIRDRNGKLHIGFPDDLNDGWYGNSTDDGYGWTTREITNAVTISAGINLVQLPNGTLYYFETDSGTGDIYVRTSNNNGATFSSQRDIYAGVWTNNELSCVADSNNMAHCCFAVDEGTVATNYYINLTGTSVRLDTVTGDGGSCDIEVDNNNIPYIINIDNDIQGNVQIFSPAIKQGWGTANPITIINASAGTSYYEVNLIIDDKDRMFVAFLNVLSSPDMLNVANSTVSLVSTKWNNRVVDALSSDDPNIAVDSNGNIQILYNNGTSTSVNDIYLANSTDGGATWINRTKINSGFKPIIQDSHFPRWNRLGTELKYSFVNLTSADLVFDRYKIPHNSTFTYVYNGTTLTNHSYSGGTLEGLEYFISDFDYLLINASWWIPARPSSFNASYTSQIIDAGSNVIWNNISWYQEVCYQCEIPNNTEVNTETKIEKGNLISPMNITGLVGLWHLNNNTNDSSGLNNQGVPIGGVNCGLTVVGQFGTACDFDGTNDNISVKDSASLKFGAGSATFAVWAKPDNINQDAAFVSKSQASDPYTQWTLAVTGPNSRQTGAGKKIAILWRQSDTIERGAYTNSDIIDGNWHHIVGVANGVTVIIYIDGVSVPITVDFNAGAWPNTDTTIPLAIGYREDSAFFINSVIDEVAIFNRSLSADEISNLYKRGALRLNLSVQSCDDSSCSGETFKDYTNKSTSINLTETSNRYFQYRFNFNTTDGNFTPKLYNVSLFYTAIPPDTTPPSIFIVEPKNQTYVNLNRSLEFLQISDNNSIWFNLNLGVNNTIIGNTTFIANGDSNNTIYLYVNDSSGNLNQSIVSFYINTVPNITYTNISTTNPILNDTNQNITWNWFASDSDGDSVYNHTANIYEDDKPFMVLNMPFDDGLPTDISGFNNNGTLKGNAAINLANGSYGYGYNGNGIAGNELNLGNGTTFNSNILNNLTDNFTIMMWIKADGNLSGQTTMGILCKQEGGGAGNCAYEVSVDTSNARFFTEVFNNSNSGVNCNSGSKSFAVGNWYHITWVYNTTSTNSYSRIYVNGTLKTLCTHNAVFKPAPSGSILAIGEQKAAFNRNFNGSIDEVMIFNRSLSSNQIMAIYRNQSILHSDEIITNKNYSVMLVSGDGANYSAMINTTKLNIDSCISLSEDQRIIENSNVCFAIYSMSDSNNDGAINISGSNISLDCNGATLQGNDFASGTVGFANDGSIGIYLSGQNNIIRDCNIRNYGVGIYNNGYNNTIYNNTIYFGGGGIYSRANGTIIDKNIIRHAGDYDSIQIDSESWFNKIYNNTIINSTWDGLQIRGSFSNISYNYLERTQHHALDFLMVTNKPIHVGFNIVEYNTINGTTGTFVSNNFSHYVYLFMSNNNLIRNNIFFGGSGAQGYGIQIQGITNSTVNRPSKGNIFANNTFDNITTAAIGMSNSINNSFFNNNFTNISGLYQNATWVNFQSVGGLFNTSSNISFSDGYLDFDMLSGFSGSYNWSIENITFRNYGNITGYINFHNLTDRSPYNDVRFSNGTTIQADADFLNVTLLINDIVEIFDILFGVNQCDPLASKGGVSNVINCNLCLEPNLTSSNLAGANLWFNSSGCGKPGCNVEFNLTSYKMLTINGPSGDACMVRLWTGGG